MMTTRPTHETTFPGPLRRESWEDEAPTFDDSELLGRHLSVVVSEQQAVDHRANEWPEPERELQDRD